MRRALATRSLDDVGTSKFMPCFEVRMSPCRGRQSQKKGKVKHKMVLQCRARELGWESLAGNLKTAQHESGKVGFVISGLRLTSILGV